MAIQSPGTWKDFTQYNQARGVISWHYRQSHRWPPAPPETSAGRRHRCCKSRLGHSGIEEVSCHCHQDGIRSEHTGSFWMISTTQEGGQWEREGAGGSHQPTLGHAPLLQALDGFKDITSCSALPATANTWSMSSFKSFYLKIHF